jgi:hypothetical protein
MATKTYTLKKRTNFVIGYGAQTVTDKAARTHSEKTKNIEFAGGVYATADTDEQAFLEGAQFADEIAST